MRRKLNEILSKVDKRFQRPRLFSRPLRIHFEFIDICNLDCIMCARQSDRFPKSIGETSLEEIRKIENWFDFAQGVGFAGNGEPFLHKDMKTVLEIIISHGAVPSVVSNFTLIDEERSAMLTELGPMILLASIDGGTEKTFEAIRRGAKFEQVVGNLRKLDEAKKKRNTPYPVLNFLTCVMKENVEELKTIVQLAADVGASVVIFQNMLPYNPECENSIIKDMKIVERAVAVARTAGEKLGVRVDWLPTGFGIESRCPERFESAKNKPKRFFCRNIWEQLHVDVKGNVRPCCFWTEYDLGNINDRTIGELWNSKRLVEVRRQLLNGVIPNDCRDCHILEIRE